MSTKHLPSINACGNIRKECKTADCQEANFKRHILLIVQHRKVPWKVTPPHSMLCSQSLQSSSLRCYRLYLSRLLCPWQSPGKDAGVGCHALLQGIFRTQGLNLSPLCLLHCRRFFSHCAAWDQCKSNLQWGITSHWSEWRSSQRSRKNKRCRGCRAKGTLLHAGWGCK